MTLLAKVGGILALTAALLLAGWGTVYGAVWASGGMISVSVDSGDGTRFSFAVPVPMVEAATAIGGDLLDRDRRLQAELGEWGPLVESLMKGLDDCPDVTLVEVIDRDSWVRVRKRGDALELRVEDRELAVRVSLPTRALARTAGRLWS